MAKKVEIVASMTDNISPSIHSIQNSFGNLDKSTDELKNKFGALQSKQNSLISTQAKLKTSIYESKREIKAATKAWEENSNAVNRRALDAANEKYLKLTRTLSNFRAESNRTSKEMRSLADNQKKVTENGSLIGDLTKAGAFHMLGAQVGELGNIYLASALGIPTGNMMSSVISGTASGAAMGMMMSHPAIGALGGAVMGTMNAFGQKHQSEDDYVKNLRNTGIEGQRGRIAGDVATGASLAAVREMDAIAFGKLMGDAAPDYLNWVRDTANRTPLEYDDLKAMSKTLATYNYSPEEMRTRLVQIGDTGAALGMNTADMGMVATGLGRMKSTGKTTLEYMNLLTERGVDAVGYLAEGLGKSKGQIYEMVSKGLIPGAEAATMIADGMGKANEGAMALMSETTSGLQSTISEMQKERQVNYGEGYNEVRGIGLRANIAHLGSEGGSDAERAIGAYQASLENEKDRLRNRAEVFAYAEIEKLGLEKDGAEAGRILMQARLEAEIKYQDTEGAKLEREMQSRMIEDTTAYLLENKSYWKSGYQLGVEYTKGMAAAIQAHRLEAMVGAMPEVVEDITGLSDRFDTGQLSYDEFLKWNPFADKRQGYQQYLASHGGGVTVTVPKLADQIIIQEEADVDLLLDALVAKLSMLDETTR